MLKYMKARRQVNEMIIIEQNLVLLIPTLLATTAKNRNKICQPNHNDLNSNLLPVRHQDRWSCSLPQGH